MENAFSAGSMASTARKGCTQARRHNLGEDSLDSSDMQPIKSIIGQGRRAEAQSSLHLISAQLSLDNRHGERHWLVDNCAFQSVIAIVIMLNSLQLGLEADFPEFSHTWMISEHIFTAIFVCELMVKLFALRRSFFEDNWNWLDFGLALTSVIDVWVLQVVFSGAPDLQVVSIIRILRMARVARILRIMKHAKRILVIFAGLKDAIRTTMCAGILLLVTIYVGSIFCVEWIGREGGKMYPGFSVEDSHIDGMEFMTEFNPHVAFGSISRAMLTLFNICLLVEWPEVVRPVMLKQPYLVIGFVMFTMLVTFGIMNIIVGIIVDNVISLSQNYERHSEERAIKAKLDVLKRVQEVVFAIDSDCDGIVTVDEISKSFNERVMQSLLAKVHLPRGCTPSEFYRILDQDGDGTLRREEFVQSFYRLLEGNDFQRSCLVQMGINDIKALVRDMHVIFQKQVEQHVYAMDTMMQEIRAEIAMCRNPTGTEVSGLPRSNVMPSELAGPACSYRIPDDMAAELISPTAYPSSRCDSASISGAYASAMSAKVDERISDIRMGKAKHTSSESKPESDTASVVVAQISERSLVDRAPHLDDMHRADNTDSRMSTGMREGNCGDLVQSAKLLREVLDSVNKAVEKEAVKEDIRNELAKCFDDAQQLLARLFEEDRQARSQSLKSRTGSSGEGNTSLSL